MKRTGKILLTLHFFFTLSTPAQEKKAEGRPATSAPAAVKDRESQEEQVVALLHSINAACAKYASAYRTGFPATLAYLGPSPSPSAKAAGLIDAAAASGKKYGYSFAYTSGMPSGGVILGYKIQADPIEPGKSGPKHFYTDQSGVVRENPSAPATVVDAPVAPKPSAPTTPGAVAPPSPAANSPTASRVHVSEKDQAARLTSSVPPVYPPLARQARISGTIRLHVIISKSGVPQSIEVLSGPPLLVASAIQAVRQYQYQPTLLNGEPVEVETEVAVVFSLTEAPK